MSRELFAQALTAYDAMEDRLNSQNRELAALHLENKKLMQDTADAATLIHELEARLKHIETVMSARVVRAAADIMEEQLAIVKEKAANQLKDLFDLSINKVENRIAEVKEVVNDNLDNKLTEEEFVSKYAKPNTVHSLKKTINNGPLPSFVNRPLPIREPDSMIRRIVLLFIGV